MKVGIVGTGRMAAARAECILNSRGAEIAWVCSRSKERAGEFLPGVAVYDRLDRAYSEGGAEAVVITSPNALHRAAAGDAFRAGLHVFLEYPPAVAPAEGEELIALAEANQRAYSIGLTHLHGGRHAAIAEYCRGVTSLGLPVSYQLTFCSGNPISRWYDRQALSGGMFVSSLYHYIDEALDYFGEPKTQSSAYNAQTLGDGTIVSDTGSIQMTFESGCIAQILYARGMKEPGVGSRCTLVFENGYIVGDDRGTHVLTPSGSDPLDYEDMDAMQVETDRFISLAHGVEGGPFLDQSVSHAQRSLVVADRAARQATG